MVGHSGRTVRLMLFAHVEDQHEQMKDIPTISILEITRIVYNWFIKKELYFKCNSSFFISV
jgi:hypothetical protein